MSADTGTHVAFTVHAFLRPWVALVIKTGVPAALFPGPYLLPTFSRDTGVLFDEDGMSIGIASNNDYVEDIVAAHEPLLLEFRQVTDSLLSFRSVARERKRAKFTPKALRAHGCSTGLRFITFSR